MNGAEFNSSGGSSIDGESGWRRLLARASSAPSAWHSPVATRR
jgi:hypothetical protein